MLTETIFITGATGFVGSATALEALKAGYRLRISVRREAQIPTVTSVMSKYADRLEFVVVQDITEETAFRGKLDGVDYVLHLASPLPHGTDKSSYFVPAIKGTTAILEEANRVSSVKKVVVTSSIAAFIPRGGIPDGGVIKEDNDWDYTVDPDADMTGPDDFTTQSNIYRASKLLAEKATWKFWQGNNPRFALVVLYPSFVYGRNPMQTTAEGIEGTSNDWLWTSITTGRIVGSITAVHIRDVAEAHIKALNPKVVDGSKYLLVGRKAMWRDVVEIVTRRYPDLECRLPADVEGGSWATDSSKAERELAMRWRSFEEMVTEVVDQQLGFRERASGGWRARLRLMRCGW